MDTCLLSEQNRFSTFPPGSRDLCSEGTGTPSISPLLTSPPPHITGGESRSPLPTNQNTPTHCTQCVGDQPAPPRGQRDSDMSGVSRPLYRARGWGSVLCSLEAVLKPCPLLPQGPIGNGWDKPLDPVAERIHLSKSRSGPQATGHRPQAGDTSLLGSSDAHLLSSPGYGSAVSTETQELRAFILHSCDVNTSGPKPGQIS